MVYDVLVPQMGESVLEGTVQDWKVKVGDRVTINQPLVELLTDKVNVEIPAEVEGILTAQFAKEGEVVPVGTRIAQIDDEKGGSKAASTEKPSQPVAAPQSSAKAAPQAPAPAAAPKPEVKGTAPRGRGKMSPKVRMMVREYGLDPTALVPTGKDGLVTVEDVQRAVDERSSAAGFTAGPIPTPPMPVLTAAGSRTDLSAPAAAPAKREPRVKVQIPKFQPLPESQRETRTPLVGARKAISDHMIMSKRTSAHVTTFEEIDLTALAEYRRLVKNDFLNTYGAKLTYMPFIVKAACVALKEFPTINASMTEKEVIVKNYFNIGVAVARDEGLIVPVLKDADRKTIVELAVEIYELGEKARTNRLMPDDVAGGTFTVTNAGMFGATASTPIIPQPQVAILGVHAITKRPWVVNDEIVIREISTFGLSFDHRLNDGHTAVQFLHRIHEYLADTNRLLLQLR